MGEKLDLEKGFRLGDWTVLPARGLLLQEGQEERPEPLVFGLLLELARRDGDVVSKDELVDALWEGRATGDSPITRAVYQLRKHLGDRDRPHRYVETLKRRGYRLLQPVQPLAAGTAPSLSADPERQPRRSSPFLRGLTIVLIAAFAAAIVWRNDQIIERDCTTIAVEPFVKASASAADAYLTYGFRAELVRTLLSVPGLCVVAADSASAYVDDLPLTERVWLDAVLTGGVQRAGDDLKVTYELVDADSGAVLGSDSLMGPVDELFDLQRRLADSVRTLVLPNNDAVLMSSTRPANFDAYEDYLRGLYAFERRGNPGNFALAVSLFESTIAADPAFGPAYLKLAMAAALAPVYVQADEELSYTRAVSLVREGIAADASIESASGAVFGYVAHQRKDWAAAELAFERATSARIVDANAFNWYSRFLASVGRLDGSLEQALTAWRMDPDNAVINSRVALSYAWLGESEQALEFFQRAERLGAAGTTHLMGYALLLATRGDHDAAGAVARRAMQEAGIVDGWVDAVLRALEDGSNRRQALEALDRAAAGGQLKPQVEVVTRMLLGDKEGAMRIAKRLLEPGEAFEMDLLWIPQFEPLRRHPQFAELVAGLGLTDYWASVGCELDDARVVCSDRQ